MGLAFKLAYLIMWGLLLHAVLEYREEMANPGHAVALFVFASILALPVLAEEGD